MRFVNVEDLKRNTITLKIWSNYFKPYIFTRFGRRKKQGHILEIIF